MLFAFAIHTLLSTKLTPSQQGGTTNDVISAIPAAIATKTSLLLGLWASGDTFANELAALKAAIETYGDSLSGLIAGISVGSEDLYRNSPTGIENKSGLGANPDTLVTYIKQVRAAIAGTAWSGASIGHVDTWTAWVNGSNDAVIENLDWLGVDAYPYFQTTMDNDISLGASLLNDALDETASASQGKPVWITETGWPVSGDKQNQAVASTDNAKAYWDAVGCPRFGSANVWWYTLQDADSSSTPSPSFGVVGSTLSTSPLFDLSCSASNTTSSSSASSSAAASTKSATGSSTKTAGGSGSGSDSSKTTLTTAASSAAASGSAYSNSTATGAGKPKSSATATGSGSTATGSGSGSGSTSSSSAGSTPSTVVTSGSTMLSTSVGAALAAVMAAMLTL